MAQLKRWPSGPAREQETNPSRLGLAFPAFDPISKLPQAVGCRFHWRQPDNR